MEKSQKRKRTTDTTTKNKYGVMAVVLSKSRLEHKEFVECVAKRFSRPIGFEVAKPSECDTVRGDVLVDRFCDEFGTLMMLNKFATERRDVVLLYVLGDWNLSENEKSAWSVVIEKRPTETMEHFVDSLR